MQPLCCICWQISLLGIRVGEASHPGPETSTVRFTALNPTAVHNKSTRLVDCGDVLLLAETSHTTKACSLETVAFRKLRFKPVWGDAVSSMHHTAHDESLRGISGGVSFHSRFPVRPTRVVFPAAWAATTRIVEGYVQLPSLVVRVFSIYGLPRGGSTMSNNKAEAATNCLLQMILQRLQLNGTPTVIGGDLNRKVTHCEAWKEFQQKGFVELHDFWKESRGVDLPPTCKTRNATTGTRHDTLLIDPRLVPLLTNACVLTEKAFDIHYPVCADFQFPKCQLYRSVWKLPASMHELEPDLQLFSRVYEENHSEIDGVVAGPSDDASLQTWSEYVERTMHHTLQQQHEIDLIRHPLNGLPTRYRGRCVPRSAVYTPVTAPVRHARCGDYEPPGEAATMLERQRIRQTRRIKSLLDLLRKYGAPYQTGELAAQQWNAIWNSTGYRGSFITWLLDWPEICLVGFDCPSADQLHDIYQIVKFDADAIVLQGVRQRRDARKYIQYIDENEAFCQNHIRRLKGSPQPPLHCITRVHCLEVSLLRASSKACPRFRFTTPDLFHDTRTLYCDSHPVVPHFEPGGAFWIDFDFSDRNPRQVKFTQREEIIEPDQLHDAFSQYWSRFWMRENFEEQFDPTSWGPFLEQLQTLPAPALESALHCDNIEYWKIACKKLKNHSSKGVCGWSAPDLKALPERALSDLATIFRQFAHRLPRHLLVARVVFLLKPGGARDESGTRPITILPMLWRLWAGVVAHVSLRAWSKLSLVGVYGAMPHVSVQDVTMRVQLQIERALKSREPVSGFCMDIQKCFNCIGRYPSQLLMRILGIPDSVTAFWANCMSGLTRVFHIGDTFSEPQPSTCGIPEGCPVSVVIMAAWAWAVSVRLSQIGVEPITYYDDWSWVSGNFALHQPALQAVLAFCQAAKLTVSLSKCWAWSTESKERERWQTVLKSILGRDQPVSVKLDAIELGILHHYAKTHRLLSFTDRLAYAGDRLARLATVHTSLQTQGHLVQTVIWPAALWGIEFIPLGLHHFERLRTKLTRAILDQPESHASPWLACNVLVGKLQDPEEYAHIQVLRNLRRYLVTASVDHCNALFADLVSHSGDYPQIHGPIGVAKRTLKRLEWSVQLNGDIVTDNLIRLHLLSTPWQRLKYFVHLAWMKVVTSNIEHRKECAGLHPLSRVGTASALEQLPRSRQRTAALQITGGYSSNMRKHIWRADEPGLCPLCGEPSAFRHIVLQCPCLADVHQSAGRGDIQRDDADAIWRIPVMMQHPDAPAFTFTSEHLSEASISPEIVHELRAAEHVAFFVDGSGLRQTSIDGRLSGWSVVACTDTVANALYALRRYQVTQILPSCFRVVALGQTTGAQTVARAELQALVVALEAVPTATVYTDCQSNVCLWEWVRKYELPRVAIAKRANEDLVGRLAAVATQPGQQVLKVRAHQNLNPRP